MNIGMQLFAALTVVSLGGTYVMSRFVTRDTFAFDTTVESGLRAAALCLIGFLVSLAVHLS